VKDVENYVLQTTIEDFQYLNCYEVEDIMVVDGKDAKGLPVDISTVVIRKCRNFLMIACVTSSHSCIAFRQFLEELSDLPVMVVLASDFFDRSTQIFRDYVCFFISQLREITDTLRALRATQGSTSPPA
jgi:glucosamine 6-phosphate synthetase-like amidotransferase/phosphosugar isomerase protein